VAVRVEKKRRPSRIRERAHRMRTRVRYGRREIERISRTATLGGLFLSFFKIGLIGFGGGLAVISQIRALVVNTRRWMTDQSSSRASRWRRVCRGRTRATPPLTSA
jgi:hypothetical protein